MQRFSTARLTLEKKKCPVGSRCHIVITCRGGRGGWSPAEGPAWTLLVTCKSFLGFLFVVLTIVIVISPKVRGAGIPEGGNRQDGATSACSYTKIKVGRRQSLDAQSPASWAAAALGGPGNMDAKSSPLCTVLLLLLLIFLSLLLPVPPSFWSMEASVYFSPVFLDTSPIFSPAH